MNPHYQARQHKLTLVPWLLLAITTTVVGTIIALPPQSSRGIVSDDFTKSRPEAKSPEATKGSQRQSPSGATAKPKPHRYRLASQPIKTPGPQTNARPKEQPVPENIIAQLGITIWRLRPATAGDTGARQLVRENGGSSEWIPERIEADTLLHHGDLVRLSIESPRTGYLYVIDRDEFSDGSAGETNLIFPIVGDDNHVYAGRLIDIPEVPFRASPKANQTGEMLDIIVTTVPLPLHLSNRVLPIAPSQLSQWEKMWGGETLRFEMEGGAGRAWTTEEQQAAARKGTRQLTRDDPAPQTIYRVSTTDNKAVLVNVRLRYGK